ncbi:MAG: hypothetical protein R2941_00660 [Desulfobacterales bacterium]
MVDSFVRSKLPKFRTAFPEYGRCRISGGIGALVVRDEVGRYAEDAGLYVLTQSADREHNPCIAEPAEMVYFFHRQKIISSRNAKCKCPMSRIP